LWYAERFGWRVIPLHYIVDDWCSCRKPDCGSQGKHPLVRHGSKDATTDPKQIWEWWQEWPTANVGIATGPESGLWVVGPDGRAGIEALDHLARQHPDGLPATPTAFTGSGGQHLFYRWPAVGEKIPNRRNHRGLPIDVRGTGGYVVASPSMNANGSYSWGEFFRPDKVPLAEAPAWLVEWARGDGKESVRQATPPSPTRLAAAPSGPSVMERVLAYLRTIPGAVSEHGGHNGTYWPARGVVYGFDLGAEEGFRVLWDHFNPRCVPPWLEKDLRHKCEDADTKPFGQPRGWLLTANRPSWNAHQDYQDDPETARIERIVLRVLAKHLPAAHDVLHRRKGGRHG
jgi:hypothetical protein